MTQPQGHDRLSPWEAEDDSAGIDDGASVPSSPLVLGDVGGVSITGQMQEQLPQQFAPAHGSELSGEVGSPGGTGSPPEIELDKGSTWGGMGITCIFAVLITLLSGGTLLRSEGHDSWHRDESVQFSWTDSSQTSGSFTLPGAPIEECSIRFHSDYDIERASTQVEEGRNEYWSLYEECVSGSSGYILQSESQGVLLLHYFAVVGRFNGGENSSVTFEPPIHLTEGATVTAKINGEKNGNNVLQQKVSVADGVSTEFTFPFNMTVVDRCRFYIVFIVEQNLTEDSSNQRLVYSTWAIDPDGNRNPPDCESQNLAAQVSTGSGEVVGFIDYQTGFVQLTLFEPPPEDMHLFATYREGHGDDITRGQFGAFLGIVAGLIPLLIWVWMVFKAYEEGLSDKGSGMLMGIIPGSILAAIVLTALLFFIQDVFFFAI